MSEHRPRKIDRETAERLLRGGSALPPDGSDALAGLLAAAAAPAQAGELAGESAALTAFWEASRSAAPSRAHSGFRTAVARFLTVKAAAAAVALTAFGGAALAAGAGALPAPLTDSGPPAHRQPAPRTSKPVIPLAPLVSPHPVGSPEPTQATGTAPTMAGLCRSYLARLKKAGFQGTSGKTRHLSDEPRYAALLKAAGGEQNIIAHCLIVLHALPGSDNGQPNRWPTASGFPTKMPTWPTGQPSWPTERTGDHGGH
ncbi:MAG: hypothetical protein JWL58_5145 [Streptosporangiaceae bacterium]|jgi:hypothetical protein|nr:hypothetical protein [Streptosporangiaceae bacterium]